MGEFIDFFFILTRSLVKAKFFDRKIYIEEIGQVSWVLYMSSSFCLLQVESCDFSQAEEERSACKAEQIHKMTTIFAQKDSLVTCL